MTCEERNSLLSLTDDGLVSLCRVDAFRASGRGGQKFNKTSSGIRVTHKATGIAAESTTYRSQFQNRHEALKRLRMAIALEIRCLPDGKFLIGGTDAIPSQKSEARALFCAQVLDAMAENGLDFASAAEKLKCTRSALTKLFERDAVLMRWLRERRTEKTERSSGNESIPPTQNP